MSDVELGKAHIRTYCENSQLVKGLRAAEGVLKSFGSKAASIGAKMTGVGDLIGLTFGKGFATKLLGVIGGATLGAAIAAPLAGAFAKVFKSGAANGLIMELTRLGGALGMIFDDLATALVPPLTTALRIVAGIAAGTATWLGNNRALFITAVNIGSTVISIGAAIAVIGKATEFVGSGFGLLAKIIPPIAAFLASPLGIVVAIGGAIALAVAAWMRFTDSGKAAAKFLLDFFAPAIKFIKQLVGGIGDALMAGDLALAGQIAFKGLEIVAATSLNFIADLIGGTLGDALADIGGKILGGDFKGAWETAVSGMAKLWADFSRGVVRVFTGAAKAVTDAWAKTVSGIANGLLKASAQGGVVGKIASLIVGADVGELQRENDRIDRQRGIRQDIFGIGAQSVKDTVDPIRQQADAWLDELNATAENAANKADANLKNRLGPGRHRIDVDEKQRELNELTNKARKEREAIKNPELPTSGDLGKVAVGFSGTALALQLQGGNSSPQKQLLDEAKKQKDLMANAATSLQKILDFFTKGNFGFGT